MRLMFRKVGGIFQLRGTRIVEMSARNVPLGYTRTGRDAANHRCCVTGSSSCGLDRSVAVFCGYFLATYQSGVLAGRIRASRRLTGAWWGLRRFCQSPNAPPLIRMKAPRPIRTVGNRICSQRSRTSAIGRRVATNLARPTSPATSTRNTMQ